MKPNGAPGGSVGNGEAPWSNQVRWLLLVAFAIAMAYVEAAVVLYLRTINHRIDPYQVQPLEAVQDFGGAEVAREAATIVMLGTVGWMAGRNLRTRCGYFLIAFGVWDIFYYVFLKVLTGWPRSLLDWDVLFLIPLPWWGPVLAPVCIAGLMVIYGTMLSQFERPPQVASASWKIWMASAVGIALALYVFMADALRVMGQGADTLRNTLPVRFNWPVFAAALLLMSAPILGATRQMLARCQRT
jgi:hypothetical protein